MVPFGLFVALDDVFVEGLVHISDLGSDYFHYDDAHHSLVGERTGERYRLSDRVRVQLVRVNMEASKIDFRLAGPAPPQPAGWQDARINSRPDPAGGAGEAAPPGPRLKGRRLEGSAPCRQAEEAKAASKPGAAKPTPRPTPSRQRQEAGQDLLAGAKAKPRV